MPRKESLLAVGVTLVLIGIVALITAMAYASEDNEMGTQTMMAETMVCERIEIRSPNGKYYYVISWSGDRLIKQRMKVK